MFELILKNDRHGNSTQTICESDSLEEIARVSAEKAGEDADALFDLLGDGGWRDND